MKKREILDREAEKRILLLSGRRWVTGVVWTTSEHTGAFTGLLVLQRRHTKKLFNKTQADPANAYTEPLIRRKFLRPMTPFFSLSPLIPPYMGI